MSNEETDTDEALMAAIRRGDRAAFARFYDRHATPVYSLAKRITGCHAEAESVASDVFFNVWRAPERFDQSRGACRAYLLMVTRSRAIDHLRAATTRKQKSSTAADLNTEDRRWREAAESPHAALIASERSHEVRSAVAGLTNEQREPLQMAFFEGLTHREISVRLNQPLGTVKTRIRSGLLKLRAALAPSGDLPREESNALS